MKYIIITIAVFIFLFLFIEKSYDGYPIEKEAIYQIMNSDSVYVKKAYSGDGFTGGFTDSYNRWYNFSVSREVGGLFLEIDTIYSVKITPAHKAPEIEFESRRYRRDFYNYVDHVDRYNKRIGIK